MTKTFLLDTNVLMRSPRSIHVFENNHVYICNTTLEELDNLKERFGETGYQAREAVREINELRKLGNLLTGIKLKNKGLFKIIPDFNNAPYSEVKDNLLYNNCAPSLVEECAVYIRNSKEITFADTTVSINAAVKAALSSPTRSASEASTEISPMSCSSMKYARYTRSLNASPAPWSQAKYQPSKASRVRGRGTMWGGSFISRPSFLQGSTRI